MDPQTIDSSFVDRLASKDFDAQQFIREIASESIGDSDILSNKVKLQVFAENTARQLRDGVTRNYSKFLTTADEVASLEDEMYHLRSLSAHYKSIRNFLRDFVHKEALCDVQIEQSVLSSVISEVPNQSAFGTTYKDESHLMSCLSMLVDQAVSIGLISKWRNKNDDLKDVSAFNETSASRTFPESTFVLENTLEESNSPTNKVTATDDGRTLLHQSFLSQLDPDNLIEKSNVQLFLLDGCVLICTAASLARPRQENPSTSYVDHKPSSMKMRRLNLLTAMDVDSSLNVTDIKDVADISTFGNNSFHNIFKLVKNGKEVFLFKATSAQSKAACVNSLMNCIDKLNSSFQSKWGNSKSVPEGTDVFLTMLWDQLTELDLAIAHRQRETAMEIILQSRQRIVDMPSGVRNSNETITCINRTLNQLEQKLVAQIRNGPKLLKEEGRSGQGLRDPSREINLLKQLGYNSDAIELFIEYQEMSFPTQNRSSESQHNTYSLIDTSTDQIHQDLDLLDKFKNESFLDTSKHQLKRDQNNRISLFFNSIRRTEQNFYANFSSDSAECVSTFLVWLGSEINDNVDQILEQAYNSAEETSDDFGILGRISEVIKMLIDGASTTVYYDRQFVKEDVQETATEQNTLNAFNIGSNQLDVRFLIDQKLSTVLGAAIREDKQSIIDLVRSWTHGDHGHLTKEPLKITIQLSSSADTQISLASCIFSNSANITKLINVAPELIEHLDKLITVNNSSNTSSSLIDEFGLQINNIDDDQSHWISATLNLPFCAVLFAKLMVIFAKQCFSVYEEQLNSVIVESLVELMKLYLHFFGQLMNQALERSIAIENTEDQMSDDVALTGYEHMLEAEFIISNLTFIVNALFKVIENWFIIATGRSSKYFVKLYEKLDRYEENIQQYRDQYLSAYKLQK